MTTMTDSSTVARKSSLNPNAPLFIPMAFQQVEDFSAEWWDLVKTTTWFREHWFHQHQDQETFDADTDEDDVANLLPDSFDLGVCDDFSVPEEGETDDAAYYFEADTMSMAIMKERAGNGSIGEAEAVARSLGLKSPKNGTRPILEPPKNQQKHVQRLSPRCTQRHIIQQPR